jgi:hypothetical protein
MLKKVANISQMVFWGTVSWEIEFVEKELVNLLA